MVVLFINDLMGFKLYDLETRFFIFFDWIIVLLGC